jgi:hydrogenase nickel incorporation protein HypA/HybF
MLTSMHERAITENLLEIALRHANQAGAKRITGLYLVIGQLSSFIDESVQFYWDILSEDTIAEKATLHFRRIPVEMACLDCQNHYSPTDKDFTCPNCSSSRVRVTAGEEFMLEAIDVD